MNARMTAPVADHAPASTAALHLEKITKVYRKGDNEVRALDGDRPGHQARESFSRWWDPRALARPRS